MTVEVAAAGPVRYRVDMTTTGPRTTIDFSNPAWPREVAPDHRDADADHTPVGRSAHNDDTPDVCAQCGLAVTSDGRRHGHDA